MKNLKILALCVFALSFNFSALTQTKVESDRSPAPAQTTSKSTIADARTRDDRYRIGFQDVLDVQVFRRAELTQRVPVSPNGTIVLFRLDKPVVAICKTERELAVDIENAYREKYLRDPSVNVVVAEQKSQAVAVIGAVERPGNFYVNRRVHLLEMLAMAGGPNKEAGTRLLVARTGSTSDCKEVDGTLEEERVAVVDFKIRDVQEGKQSFWMQPGDVISVMDADVVYVYGNVMEQGSYRVREPITLTQAIVSAKGLKPAARKSSVRVLRQVPGSLDRKEIIYDLNKIDKGVERDPFLEPNDIVAVSEDKTKAILLGFANSIKNSLPSVLYRLP